MTFLGDDFWRDSIFSSCWFEWIRVYVSLQRLLGYFTQVVREGGLGPCGPFSLPIHTCLLRRGSGRARRRQQWHAWFCWLQCTSRCVGISRWSSALLGKDFRHHGRFGQDALHQPLVIPQVQFLDKFDVQFRFVVPAECRHGPDSAENRGVLHAVPDKVVGLPVVCNGGGGLVQTLSLKVPQLQLFFKDVHFPVVAQKLFPWSRLFS